jgi:hypothetical protein
MRGMRQTNEAWPLGAQLKSPVTITHLPDWAMSTDVVVRRGKRYWLVSTHQSERRWQAWWGWVRKVVEQWIETH